MNDMLSRMLGNCGGHRRLPKGTKALLRRINAPSINTGALVTYSGKLVRPTNIGSAIAGCKRALRLVDIETTDTTNPAFFKKPKRLDRFRDLVTFADKLMACETADALQEAWNAPPDAYAKVLTNTEVGKYKNRADKAAHRLVMAAFQHRAYEMAEKIRIKHRADKKKKDDQEETRKHHHARQEREKREQEEKLKQEEKEEKREQEKKNAEEEEKGEKGESEKMEE